MPFSATVRLIDSLNREKSKTYEMETDVLATAQTAMALLITDLEAVTDLGVVSVSYVFKDDSEASAAAAGSNVDEGGTFRLRLNNGKIASYKIPGFPIAKAASGGNIDVSDVDVAAYFANFEPAGSFTLSEGNTVSDVLTGSMDV
jgi:hypothetical protein